MSEHTLSISETLQAAWASVKGSKSTFWIILGFFMLIQIAIALLDKGMHSIDSTLTTPLLAVIKIAFNIISLFMMWGLIYIGILRASNMPIRYGMIRHVFSFGLLLRMIGLGLLQFLILLPAIFLLFLPTLLRSTDMMIQLVDVFKIISAFCYIVATMLGIYLLMRLYLARAIVIAENAFPWTAVKKSFQLTKSNALKLFGITLASMILLIISMIPFGIGLIWSLPFIFIVYGMVYKKLTRTIS